MSNISIRLLSGAVLLSALALAPGLQAREKPTEDQLIESLSNTDPKAAGKVCDAMLALEKQFPTSTKALSMIKQLLTDERPEVRRKAARVLGALHAEVGQADIKNICALLKSADWKEAQDGLKALRGLKAPAAVAEIVPLLSHANNNVARDACRTLAVLGTKSVIPSIEPLLKHQDPAVQRDAQDAIFALREK